MYTDESIKHEADVFISRGTTLKEVAEFLGIGYTTLQVHISDVLCYVDPKRYAKAREIIDRNIEKRNNRFRRKKD